MASQTPSARSFRLMLVYQLTQHTPLYWPYMFLFITNVRGLPAADFGLLKSIYYFTVMAAEVPFGVVADRLGRRTTLVLGALANSGGCVLYATGGASPRSRSRSSCSRSPPRCRAAPTRR